MKVYLWRFAVQGAGAAICGASARPCCFAAHCICFARCPAVYAFRRRRKYARWAFPIAEFLTAIVSAVMLMKVLRKERSLTPNGGGENGKSTENLSGAFYFQKNDGWPEGNASGEHSERNG